MEKKYFIYMFFFIILAIGLFYFLTFLIFSNQKEIEIDEDEIILNKGPSIPKYFDFLENKSKASIYFINFDCEFCINNYNIVFSLLKQNNFQTRICPITTEQTKIRDLNLICSQIKNQNDSINTALKIFNRESVNFICDEEQIKNFHCPDEITAPTLYFLLKGNHTERIEEILKNSKIIYKSNVGFFNEWTFFRIYGSIDAEDRKIIEKIIN